jgi:hypothetical protein
MNGGVPRTCLISFLLWLCSLIRPTLSFGIVATTTATRWIGKANTRIDDTVVSLSETATTSSKEGGDSPSSLSSNEDELDNILQVAIVASRKAGDIILQNANGADVVEKKSTSRDLLTLIDPICEKVSNEDGHTMVYSYMSNFIPLTKNVEE